MSARSVIGVGGWVCLLAAILGGCARDRSAPFDVAPTEPVIPDTPEFGVDGGAAGDGAAVKCAGATVPLARAAVYMLVILDGSGSMLDPLVPNGPTGLKWKAARDAFVSFVDDTAARQDTSFGVGLFLFDGTKGVPDFTQVDVGIHYVDPVQANQLKSRVQGAEPQGGTPLKLALQGQIPFLESFVPSLPLKKNGKRVLVVMTDGIPDGPSDVQPVVQQQCIDLIEKARTGPGKVTTFAVGVGDPASDESSYNEVFMGRLAVAGGSAPDGCDPGWNQSSPPSALPCHFQITPGAKTAAEIRDELFAAINAIRGAAASCEFPLEQADGTVGVPDPNDVKVIFTNSDGDDSDVPKDAANGWSYDDDANPRAVIFHGAACRQVTAEADGQVKIALGCNTNAK